MDAAEPRHHWLLDPDVTFLNHGSFGACPRPVLAEQQRLRTQLERQPVAFFLRDHEPLMDQARRRLGEFIGASPSDLVFIANATTAVNAVLASAELQPGDQVLRTDHVYNACSNSVDVIARARQVEVVVAHLPVPVRGPDQVVQTILSAVTDRTRLALIDHVTSTTALVLPIERVVAELAKRGVETLVDGAHAPGMLPLDVEAIGAAWYTGNCHKWICAPKGAAFLHVREDLQERTRAVVTSHAENAGRADRPLLHQRFDWTGTHDPTAFLSVPAAIDFMATLAKGGWPQLMADNRALAVAGLGVLQQELGLEPIVPVEMLGSMATVCLPAMRKLPPSRSPLVLPFQDELLRRYRIEVPVFPSPLDPNEQMLRISAQRYNGLEDYHRLALAIRKLT